MDDYMNKLEILPVVKTNLNLLGYGSVGASIVAGLFLAYDSAAPVVMFYASLIAGVLVSTIFFWMGVMLSQYEQMNKRLSDLNSGSSHVSDIPSGASPNPEQNPI